ncbi:MAG: FAD/NAD(P)-binding protein [Candidatus Melainabacteria bacterium]|nr:MAG: FAD/NAD(P)-binding protein [Candidatus Melainabacteria bacterium]
MKNPHIGIVGGGPGALLILMRILELEGADFALDIFESAPRLGVGMPFSPRGADLEHDTNVSEEEIPDFEPPLSQWVKTQPPYVLEKYGVDPQQFDETSILPRLLFGEYLHEQFEMLLKEAEHRGMEVKIHFKTHVDDIKDDIKKKKTAIIAGDKTYLFDNVIICCGHFWPHDHERELAGYFDSPYPPSKLNRIFDHPVALRGSSLTAVDAIRTISRNNGIFTRENSRLIYTKNENAPNFKMVMYSHNGLLPCARIHLEEPNINNADILPSARLKENMAENDGFLSLDFLFDIGYKELLKDKDPELHIQIKDMKVEEFSKFMLSKREAQEPFELLREEYLDGIDSLQTKRPVPWKEALSAFSFALNFPAKHMSAEDMIRLHEHLLPLVAIVIAYLPPSSCEEMLALHDSGCLDLVSVDKFEAKISEGGKIVCTCKFEDKEDIVVEYETFVDCIGQPNIEFEQFPFKSLMKGGTVSQARLNFKSNKGHQNVDGLQITDSFQVVNEKGEANKRVYLLTVAFMKGLNPDFSGIDFFEHATELVVKSIFSAKI